MQQIYGKKIKSELDKLINQVAKGNNKNKKRLQKTLINYFKLIINAFRDNIFGRIFDDEELGNDGEFYNPQESPRDIPDLGSEESAAQRNNQAGEGIKILAPNQMLSILHITLAQLQGGNYSNKLKNEMSQLLHSLYCSK